MFFIFHVQKYYRGWVKEELETAKEQEVMGSREAIKGMRQNSRWRIRSTYLGSHSKKVHHKLLI